MVKGYDKFCNKLLNLDSRAETQSADSLTCFRVCVLIRLYQSEMDRQAARIKARALGAAQGVPV
jgi:hypothetical protein